MCSTSSISHLTTKSSKTLETIAVREIGLKSPLPVMGVTLGTGVTLESFHAVGKLPQQFVRTHLYSWVEKGIVRVQCLAQEHNKITLVRALT